MAHPFSPSTLQEPNPPNSSSNNSSRSRRPGLWLALILALAFCLYTPALRWGLPGVASWSQDTIAGFRTIGAVERWPQQWVGRYPPLQYFILRAAYEPILNQWLENGSAVADTENHLQLTEPYAPKIGTLNLIARSVTVAMALATLLGLWMAARAFADDDLAAHLCTATFALGAAFTYFAHLGNVDVPSMCWFSWSFYFYVKVLRSRSWLDAALLGLLGSLAIGTKDALAGVYAGMALVVLASEVLHQRKEFPLGRAIVRAMWQPNWLLGIALFVLPYLALYGALFDPSAYFERMSYWLSPAEGTLHARQVRYTGQVQMMWATVRYAAGAVGWPMLAAIVASTIYFIRSRGKLALVLLIPVLSYYVIVICRIHFVYSRFLFAPLVLLAVITGVAGSALVRNRRLPSAIRATVALAVLLPSLAYAVAINAEMMTDSRYRVEQWFQQNVEPPSSVGAFLQDQRQPLNTQYLPRFPQLGYATFPVALTKASFDRTQPDYLVLTSYDYEDYDKSQRACMSDLLAGKYGYDEVARFTGRYLDDHASLLGVAGWFAPTPGKISPTVIVLRRTVRLSPNGS